MVAKWYKSSWIDLILMQTYRAFLFRKGFFFSCYVFFLSQLLAIFERKISSRSGKAGMIKHVFETKSSAKLVFSHKREKLKSEVFSFGRFSWSKKKQSQKQQQREKFFEIQTLLTQFFVCLLSSTSSFFEFAFFSTCQSSCSIFIWEI